MRVALAGQLITHWMGDDAFLWKLQIDLPKPFIYGDTLRLMGIVRDKFLVTLAEREYHAVEIEIAGRNQLDEVILEGSAVVFLSQPGRPVQIPLPAPDIL